MLTGFEALGAASAVLQVIAFAGSVTSQCYKIYDGQVTSQQDLEAYATQMIDAVGRVQERYPLIPQGSSDEKKLAEIAQQCIEAARALRAETQLVTKLCKRGSLSKAFYAAFRASRHRGKIEQLEKSLQGCQEVMETHLLFKLCTRSDAIEKQQSQSFQDLDSDVKHLISQIAEGYRKTEDLIRAEQHKTRGVIAMEANTTRQEFKEHIALEVQGLGASLFSGNRYERLLGSLKVSEMNQRYHDVMDSTEASFERVFLSYERVTANDRRKLGLFEDGMLENRISDANAIHTWSDISKGELLKIDQAWTSFISWLYSKDEKVFWIRGKPGSGKSTLVKFVLENDNTKHLLESWSPGAKIASHFFWKIGTSPQNSIKGLLCSLLYSALDGETDMIDQVFQQFPASSSKDSYHDWSSRELELVLFLVLDSQTWSKCIFIDGLDELSDKDGVSKLKPLIEKLNTYSNIKVCVSSRPETQLMNMLGTIGARSLRLEDLTRPEMAVYVRKELIAVEASMRLSLGFHHEMANTLLDKAEGVFLWLFLAMNSVANGIQNSDEEETLRQRLQALPRELEELYADMWARLNANNSVYWETAGRYFHYAIAERFEVAIMNPSNLRLPLERLTLAEIALAEATDIDQFSTPKSDKASPSDLKQLCDITKQRIEARCAGLLQLRNSRRKHLMPEFPGDFWPFIQEVSFIHRTAHDFLVDTEAGQHILNHKNNPSLSADTDVRLLKSLLRMAVLLHNEFGMKMDVDNIIRAFAKFFRRCDDYQTIETLLPIAQDLFNRGMLSDYRPAGFPLPHFVSLLARQTSLFHAFIIPSLESTNSASIATDVLREISGSRQSLFTALPQLVRGLIALGANPHAPGLSLIWVHLSPDGFSQQTTAFQMVLRGALNEVMSGIYMTSLPASVDLVEAMAQTCPNWHMKMLIARELEAPDAGGKCELVGWEDSSLRSWPAWVACEVDLQFLLMRFIAAVSLQFNRHRINRLVKLSETFTEPFARIRHIVSPDTYKARRCYRIITQEETFQDILNDVFTVENYMEVDDFCSIINIPANTEKIYMGSISSTASLQ
ncbi:hypothetical protein FSARC_5526 [Fusarium sarcochroum]|uniref:NACHT domain-containing protein n=1 Tax=Fusarium sarcochroum TaxID=1208366 RepID=A0A8H4TZH0_9HYPO|nr:hypothetical protein FSARC_5526 [Fusarium sarcochroum]